MLTAFVAIIDDEITDLCARGNGKTNAMVFYLYLYHLRGYQVWSNFYTSFSDKICGFQEMINTIRQMRKNGNNTKVVFGVTEIQDLINSMGSTVEQTLFVDSFINQMRKLDIDCLFDTQIFKNINIRLRRQTENIRICFKKHLNGKDCNFDRCDKKHYIDVYSYKPWRNGRKRRLKAWIVGQMYDSKEIIIDTLQIIKESKPENKESNKNKKSKKVKSEIEINIKEDED
jgi:hypothetical protein